MHFTHHRAVLFIALAAFALHLRHAFYRQRRGRLLELQLDLRETLVQAGFFSLIRRKEARLNTGGARLVIDNQQRFGEIKAVIRAAIGLRKRRQFFKPGDEIVGKQPAEEHRFALVLRQHHRLLQQTKSVEYRQRTQTLIFIQQRTYRREAQRAPLWPGLNGDGFRQGVIQKREQRRAVGAQRFNRDSVTVGGYAQRAVDKKQAFQIVFTVDIRGFQQ
ncbi:hypothetical protein BN129_1386 [Cronobacter sakazakii 701]|nr:hypothetical protein BN129_1386 [Cronobacter sakazakii 701]